MRVVAHGHACCTHLVITAHAWWIQLAAVPLKQIRLYGSLSWTCSLRYNTLQDCHPRRKLSLPKDPLDSRNTHTRAHTTTHTHTRARAHTHKHQELIAACQQSRNACVAVQDTGFMGVGWWRKKGQQLKTRHIFETTTDNDCRVDTNNWFTDSRKISVVRAVV